MSASVPYLVPSLVGKEVIGLLIRERVPQGRVLVLGPGKEVVLTILIPHASVYMPSLRYLPRAQWVTFQDSLEPRGKELRHLIMH